MPIALPTVLRPWKIARDYLKKLRWIENYASSTLEEVRTARVDSLLLSGQIALRTLPPDLASIQDAEFRVFSQFGEDGIIQFLVQRLSGRMDHSFVEFGVQTYREANTLFLLMNNGWRGLVIDGEKNYIDNIRERGLDWKYGLHTRCDFVTRENINHIFESEGFTPELGLLSIDVDGVDWHLWDALTVVNPAIVVVEYNPAFPVDRPITVPYEPTFNRHEKHPANCYFGASLGALVILAREKAYTFIGVGRHRQNAFFVRDDLAPYVPHDKPGAAHANHNSKEVMEALRGMPVYNAATKTLEAI